MQYAALTCGAHRLQIQVCESGLERLRGLLGRPEPEPSVAVLLDPCWAVHTFGMRYPIDVVFCDERWRVIRIVTALRPNRAARARGASRVLELRANSARPLGFVVGAKVEPEARLRSPPRAGAAEAFARVTVSPPVRALAGLAVLTLCAAWLVGGCTAARPPTADPAAAGIPQAVAGRADPAAEARSRPLEEARLQADIEYASRAWPLAEAAYRELLLREPRNARHWERLGVVFLRTGRASEAVEALQAATRLSDTDARMLQNLALAHLRAASDALDAAARRSDERASVTAGATTGPSAAEVRAPPDAAALRSAADAVERLLPHDLRVRLARTGR